jgi:hypothetical protein
MKYLLIILPLLVMVSCSSEKKRSMTVYMSNGTGFNLASCHISVDSVTTTTPTSATIWIDGIKTTVHAERIMLSN